MGTILSGFVLAAFPSAEALDPKLQLSQYAHTAWRVREGYFSAPPLAIAQTKDGQLWLGGEGGLLRFDGVQFSAWKPPGGQGLPDERIYGLLGASDGSLWIGTGWGLARWVDGKLVVYAKAGRFSTLLEDESGTIWAGHTRATNTVPPLCRFAGGEFRCFKFSDHPGRTWVGALKEDHSGNLWIGTDGAVCRWQADKEDCYAIPASNPVAVTPGVQCLAIDSGGALWVDGGRTGIWQLHSGHWKHYDEFPELKLEMRASLLDREGAFWLGGWNHGILRNAERRTERLDRTDGLSDDTVNAVFEDREGNIWIATTGGLDRLRNVKVSTITPGEGLPMPVVESIVASRDGGLWISAVSTLIHATAGKPVSYDLVPGLPATGNLGATFEDSRGRLWLGVGNYLEWRQNGLFHRVASLKLHASGERVRAIAEDVTGVLWVATTDPEFALARISDGHVLEHFTIRQIGAQVSAMAADPGGGMWLSRSPAPGLTFAHDGMFEARANTFPGSSQMFIDSHGLWASTRQGVALYRDGAVKLLTTKNGLPCDNLDAAIKDDNGALWLKGTCGLLQIPASELELWLKEPTYMVKFRYLDAFDGVQAGVSSFAHVAKTSDGRIWFALEEIGIQVVDPNHLEDNPDPPPVAVTNLIVDHRTYSLSSELRLPALTRELEIDYTAYSLTIPEKVGFRYRLDGVDKDWQGVGSRRQAYFANLKPGSYRFKVSASNNDGVWNEGGATLAFAIAPAFYQTMWFWLLCLAIASMGLYLLYLLRLNQATQRVRTGMEERLAERERIARDLHDTLLQSVQGLILKFHAIANRIPTIDPARRQIEETLDHADQVLAEGRDRVRNLRAPTIGFGELPKAFQRVVEEVAPDQAPNYKTVVEGTVLELHPIIREETYWIGREALINALTHSESRNIETEIIYDSHEFRLRIRDDGRGIDPDVLKSGGRADHWGLQGMKERAQRIGAHLDIWSRAGTGTEVELKITAATAYRALRGKPDSRQRVSATG
jgi:signal transduction histidine kinase/ligand-binding sensor domain-containing protein